MDVAIIEVGMGGEYDPTNVLERPYVCGVASLGFDHMRVLGDTLGKIAWHKAGIFKVRERGKGKERREREGGGDAGWDKLVGLG